MQRTTNKTWFRCLKIDLQIHWFIIPMKIAMIEGCPVSDTPVSSPDKFRSWVKVLKLEMLWND